LKTETIPFRDFMNGSYKKKVITYAFVPVGGIVFNEPTVFIISTITIGMGAFILEKIAENREYPFLESIRQFRSFYNKYVVPSTVIGSVVYLFALTYKVLL